MYINDLRNIYPFFLCSHHFFLYLYLERICDTYDTYDTWVKILYISMGYWQNRCRK